MDAYSLLFLKCTEYEVYKGETKVPLWQITKEDIKAKNVNFDLPWSSIQDLAITLFDILKDQRRNPDLTYLNLEEILVGISFLNSESSGTLISNQDMATIACINHLDDLLSTRISKICAHNVLMKMPETACLFEKIAFGFPQKKDVKITVNPELTKIIQRLRNCEFESELLN
ncbi:hypothetical protein [Methanococcus voltae]|uniref:Uncharacterized protein n=1 Tax=Methanococcus voltae (strain ATCC BAA-1334 / A3) TaxID=456320 RepID=D7DTP2_METV3|nr:hypothetical protein [Methanococcus voltae]MCS3901356.1 hypothetical protein [Methanococcus voltae]